MPSLARTTTQHDDAAKILPTNLAVRGVFDAGDADVTSTRSARLCGLFNTLESFGGAAIAKK